MERERREEMRDKERAEAMNKKLTEETREMKFQFSEEQRES